MSDFINNQIQSGRESSAANLADGLIALAAVWTFIYPTRIKQV